MVKDKDEPPLEEVHIAEGPEGSQVQNLLSSWSWGESPSWNADVFAHPEAP